MELSDLFPIGLTTVSLSFPTYDINSIFPSLISFDHCALPFSTYINQNISLSDKWSTLRSCHLQCMILIKISPYLLFLDHCVLAILNI